MGQTHWEDSVMGGVCVTRCMDQHRHRQQTQSLIRGIVKARSRRAKGSINISSNATHFIYKTNLTAIMNCENVSVLSFYLSFGAVPVPSCADIRGTFPSAWTSTQLSRMTQEDMKQCVEVFAQDASMSPEQRRAVWVKLRQVSKTE